MLKWRLPKPVFWSNIDFFGGKISLWAIAAGGEGLLFKSNLFRDKAIIRGAGAIIMGRGTLFRILRYFKIPKN